MKSKNTNFINFLESKKVEDYDLLGEKAYRLSLLKNTGIKIPESFVISSIAFDSFISINGIGDKITEYLSKVRVFDRTSAANASGFITNILMANAIPNIIEKSILLGYSSLGNDFSNPFVNIEYSHLIPDNFLPDFIKVLKSGEIKGESKLIEKIKFFWAGLFATESIEFRSNNYYNGPISTALIVKKVTRSELSGSFKSISDLGGNFVEIKALYGLPFSSSTPEDQSDKYIIDLSNGAISEKIISPQQFMNVRKGSMNSDIDSSLIRVEISNQWQTKQKIQDSVIQEVFSLGSFLEKFYGAPIEAKWEIENSNIIVTDVNILSDKEIKLKIGDFKKVDIVKVESKKNNLKKIKDKKEDRQKPKIDLDAIAKEIRSINSLEKPKRNLELNFVLEAKENILIKNKHANPNYLINNKYYNLNYISLGVLENAFTEGYGGFLDLSPRIKEIGFLPEDYSANSEKINQIIQALAIDISISAKNFEPGNLIYALSSFSSKEYSEFSKKKEYLDGDERFIKRPQSISIELESIKRAREVYECPEFAIMIPSVRNFSNLQSIYSLLKVQGFDRNKLSRVYSELYFPSFTSELNLVDTSLIDGVIIDYDKLKLMLFGKTKLLSAELNSFKNIFEKQIFNICRENKLEIIINLFDVEQADSDDILDSFDLDSIILPVKI